MKHIKIIIAFLLVVLFGSCTQDQQIIINQNPTNFANRQTTGAAANDLLSDNTYTSMVVELVYVDGFEPSKEAVDNFISFIKERTYKPEGIILKKRAISSPGKTVYTINEIAEIEKKQRRYYNTDNQIALWVYFSDGKSDKDSESDNTAVLGTAYWSTSFVVFEKTVQGFSDSSFEPKRAVLETTVINHEFGHLLGLTNLGTTMHQNHEDTDHPKHCNNKDCLMYWASESGANISNLVGMGSAPNLDANCIADLKANGGK
ncbi:membrane metalloprotease [Tenacibaculum sp. UWU-22]|uniref:membrane metalloprotease n=1 Tax=Tenacibaculum sp. UWU-22 TaxID=3234187 RepID=UPI0034DAD487